VVASEVKALANQTAQATEEISTQIQSIQAATSEAVGAIQSIGGTIAEINEISNAIAAAVDQQGAATREISATCSRRRNGTKDVNDNIVGSRRLPANSVPPLQNCSTPPTDCHRQSERLKLEVDSFLGSVARRKRRLSSPAGQG